MISEEEITCGTNGGGSFFACNDIRLTFAISFVDFIAASEDILPSGRTHKRDWMNFVNSGDHLFEYLGC